ncbi:MAG: Pyrimidine-nucleoside phosphorylase [Candidatus Ozemobacter sibiricus]|jgi:pyrimidine-nucleoside phosphorylase|uniref:Pyrimidine-nucleoside phosphorylase n=1 Tax=Candidatus Ozemobacter sibiricus TaxID=2268124 RepID=A0A367ZUT3_9BACT|nr:MAG: Pyrimidine-nucleoside phosphorylase [Candidatus Ozemobacter sibiricus]
MRAYEIIKRKRDGLKLQEAEVRYVIDAFVAGTLPDYQMAAFLMAVFLRGMDEQETFWLTDAMRLSGDQVELRGIEGFTVDKHSTGGVGDKTSLVLGPVLAALGLKVAKLSGRGLGHTGGTIDKLESIAGFSCDLSPAAFVEAVNRIGIAIIGQTPTLVPADKKIYALRDVTATVDSIPLIAASIMSKKLAVQNKALILDVKVGSGAFMKTLAEARELARLMVKIGKQAGRQVAAVLSNMDEPLGRMIGNALEVKEAIATLRGEGPADLVALVKALAQEALLAQDRRLPQAEAASRVEQAIRSGKAWEVFVAMVRNQGGDPALVENPARLPTAKAVLPLVADRSGYVARIECEEVGLAAMMLGAGRETKEAVIDPAVGFHLLKKVGDAVQAGEVLAEVHVDPARDNAAAMRRLQAAYRLSDQPVAAQPLILDIVS